MEFIMNGEKFDKACSTDEDFRIDMEDYVSSSQWKMRQIETILTALMNNKFVSLNRQKSHSIVSSVYSQSQEKSKRRSRHKHCHNIKHHHRHHRCHSNAHKQHSELNGNERCLHSNEASCRDNASGCHGNHLPALCTSQDEEEMIQSREDLARIKQWSSETSDPQLLREGVRDGKIQRKRRRKRRRKRNGGAEVVMIDPNDLPKRAKWTIIITAGLLLLTCMLLVGITLRMAPIIDQMVRNQNEELLNSLNRQELNESMYLLMAR